MASGDSSLYFGNSVKGAKAHAQCTVAPSLGGPDAISGPSTGAPTPSWAPSGVLTTDLRDVGLQQASSLSSRGLQRSPGALDLTRSAGIEPEEVAKNPPKRKLSKLFPEYGAGQEDVGGVLPMDIGGPQVAKKTASSKRSRKYNRLVRALERLHITDAGEQELARTGKGASSNMNQDGAEDTSGGRRRTASEQGKASRKRSKGQKKKAGRASSADAVAVARAQKGKEGKNKKKSRGADGKQRRLGNGGEEKKPKKNSPQDSKKPRSAASTCSPGGGKSKRPRRATTSDPGSPSVVKPTAHVHLR